MALNKYVEHQSMVHTIRIELIDEKVLLYGITNRVKDELEKWFASQLDDFMSSHHKFLRFHTASDKIAFVRISSIRRLVFCWDLVPSTQAAPQCYDNYKVATNDEEDILIAELIIKLRNNDSPLVYMDLDSDSDFLGFDEDSFKNVHYLKGGFISVRDEEGEQNYIPITNIECIEVKRSYIYSDDEWEELQNISDIEDNAD